MSSDWPYAGGVMLVSPQDPVQLSSLPGTAMISVAEALGPVLAKLAPVSPMDVAVSEATGLVSAETVVVPSALPADPVALRGGYAVSSLDCIGASPQSPVWLSAMPVAVQAGEVLPPGCDAVLPKDGFSLAGHVAEIMRTVAPGENARLRGHELRHGDVLVEAGTLLSAMTALLLQEAGVARLAIRAPRVAVQPGPPASFRWVLAMLAGAGCRLVDQDPDLALVWSTESESRLALVPGDLAFVAHDKSVPVVALPRRFDGVIAAYFALVLPIIERLRGAPEPLHYGTLRRKLTSTIGMSEIALFRTLPDGLDPLATGAVTLQALAQADRIALVAPDCEGYPAGTTIATWSIELAPHRAIFLGSTPEDPS